MKRPLISATAAALLALALLPGSAGAVMPGDLDQNVGSGGGLYLTNLAITQTFTVGTTGALTHVELFCQGATGTVNVDLYVNLTLAGSASCTTTAGWVDFILPQSQLMAMGSSATLQIVPGGDFFLGVAASPYDGGMAGDQNGDPIGIQDFAFRTYVLPYHTIDGLWNPFSYQAGVSTPATLTITNDFPAVSLNPIQQPVVYVFNLGTLPAYFVPAPGGMTCSAPIALVDCTLAALQSPSGIQAGGNGDAVTVTITIAGTISPGSGDVGPDGVGVGSCLYAYDDPVEPSIEVSMCNYADAYLQVGEAGTPPPTTTIAAGGSGGGPMLWWLPAGLVALGGALLMVRRQTSLIR
jgi:hypothetical protein